MASKRNDINQAVPTKTVEHAKARANHLGVPVTIFANKGVYGVEWACVPAGEEDRFRTIRAGHWVIREQVSPN